MYVAEFALVVTIVPTVEFPPVTPLTSQAIVAPAAVQKDAVNVCAWPRGTLTGDGEMEFVDPHSTVTLALPDFELSAVLVAVTVTVAGEGGTAGAV